MQTESMITHSRLHPTVKLDTPKKKSCYSSHCLKIRDTDKNIKQTRYLVALSAQVVFYAKDCGVTNYSSS